MNANKKQFYDAFLTGTTTANTTQRLSTSSLVVLLLASLLGVTSCGLFHKKTPLTTYDDPQLRAKVEDALKSEPLLKDSRIAVQSQNGVVELSGEVGSPAAKERAGLAAASVPGIVQVKNDVLVRSRP
jgi:osmotically-inducible protein OsmY